MKKSSNEKRITKYTKLAVKREAIASLTTAELQHVVGASVSSNDPLCDPK